MRRKVEVNATIAHPVDLVFAYLADPLRWHEFVPACVFRRQIGDQPRVGTRWMATDRIGPFRFTSSMSWPSWSPTAAWSGCRAMELANRTCARRLVRAPTSGRATGDITGWLR
jgi:hypothetical protein